MTRAIILVLDSFGIGATADADKFGDVGANTFGNIARVRADSDAGPLRLPNLASLGLFHAGRDSAGEFPAGADPDTKILGSYGFAGKPAGGIINQGVMVFDLIRCVMADGVDHIDQTNSQAGPHYVVVDDRWRVFASPT